MVVPLGYCYGAILAIVVPALAAEGAIMLLFGLESIEFDRKLLQLTCG